MEHPSIAIHLPSRFPSVQLQRNVRALLLDYPEKAIYEPDSLHLLLGPSLPPDLSTQLKVSFLRHLSTKMLNLEVPSVLGSGQSHNSSDILSTRI